MPTQGCGRVVVRHQGSKEENFAARGYELVVPGTRTTIRAMSESPEAIEASALWAVTIARSFLHRLLGARDIVDVQIAAGAALQDLEEWAGDGQFEEPNPGVDPQ